jgi:uncharacterized protein YutE (UPF0331/DUF86 family)
MYYVDIRQIEDKLRFIPRIAAVCRHLQQNWIPGDDALGFAQERALQLAIETVTDVGSLMIDGFLMRDAGSYEDIIEILQGENVFPRQLAEPLVELVMLRKPLVRDYVEFDRGRLHPMIGRLPDLLDEFAQSVRAYLSKESAL